MKEKEGNRMKESFELFLIFSRIGAVTFGGGYAMLPILQKEIVEKKKWATEEEILDFYAISQCTPGIIAINTAIFVGYKCNKVKGAIASALGMVFPSIVIILILAMFLQHLFEYAWVQKAFAGIRVAVAALVVNATLTLVKKGVVDKLTGILFVAVFAILMFVNISPTLVIIGAAVVGIVAHQIKGAKA